jgi:hypothetical protein
MHTPSTRLAALGAFAALCLATSVAKAQDLNTADFVAACVKDPVITEDPGFDDAKVTPQIFCECVAGQLQENKSVQTDVDMLVKMHNEAITDADAASFPKLDELLVANEGFEDACREKLGLSIEDGDDLEELPEEEEIPEEGVIEEGEPPQDGEQPPQE